MLYLLIEALEHLYWKIRGEKPFVPTEPEFPLPWCTDDSNENWCALAQVCRFNCWDID